MDTGLQVVFFQDGQLWIGVSLQHCLSVQASTFREAIKELKQALIEQIQLDLSYRDLNPIRL